MPDEEQPDIPIWLQSWLQLIDRNGWETVLRRLGEVALYQAATMVELPPEEIPPPVRPEALVDLATELQLLSDRFH